MLYYSDKLVLDLLSNVEKSMEGCRKINDNRDSITIIGFYEVVVRRAILERDINIISPSVVFEHGSIVNLSSTVTPKDRPHKENMKRKGLPGLPGTPGNNLTVSSLRCNVENINFISKGTRGGRGQNGEPPGEDGKEGLLEINLKLPRRGKDPERRSIGTDSDISTYKQIAYIGINDKKNSSELMSLFRL